MKRADAGAGDEVQQIIQAIGRCLSQRRRSGLRGPASGQRLQGLPGSRGELEELPALRGELLAALGRTGDVRQAAFERFLDLLESGVRAGDVALTNGALSALVALAGSRRRARAIRFDHRPLRRAA